MNEKRASAKAIAVGSLTAFFGGCIVNCIFIVIASIMAVGSQVEDWEALEYRESMEMLFENTEMPVFFIIVTLAVIWGGFALLGGYIAGRMGKEEPVLNGTWVGGIVGGILLLPFPLMAGNFLRAFLNAFIGLGLVAVVLFLARWGGQLAGRGAEEEE